MCQAADVSRGRHECHLWHQGHLRHTQVGLPNGFTLSTVSPSSLIVFQAACTYMYVESLLRGEKGGSKKHSFTPSVVYYKYHHIIKLWYMYGSLSLLSICSELL